MVVGFHGWIVELGAPKRHVETSVVGLGLRFGLGKGLVRIEGVGIGVGVLV